MKKLSFLAAIFLLFFSFHLAHSASILNFRTLVEIPGLDDIEVSGKMHLLIPSTSGKVDGTFNILKPEKYDTMIKNGFRNANVITGNFIVRIPESYFAEWLNVKDYADVFCEMKGTLTPLGILNGELKMSFLNPTHPILEIFSLESDFVATY